jgi:Ca-activated chloride channel family protein
MTRRWTIIAALITASVAVYFANLACSVANTPVEETRVSQVDEPEATPGENARQPARRGRADLPATVYVSPLVEQPEKDAAVATTRQHADASAMSFYDYSVQSSPMCLDAVATDVTDLDADGAVPWDWNVQYPSDWMELQADRAASRRELSLANAGGGTAVPHTFYKMDGRYSDSWRREDANGILLCPSEADVRRVEKLLEELGEPVDETLIIAKAPAGIPVADQIPGSGELRAKVADKQVPVPLKHTDVKANIAGYIATVDVTQQYENPYDEKIEAVYVFPLPQDAAVSDFIMTIGERRIRGIIREREEAEEIYAAAKAQGHVASLLTQERPNIFTQAVANIEPGKQIDINIKYFNTLAYDDGWYEFVFPMVVGPRFNPPGSTDGVGAVPNGAEGTSGQATEVTYLKPNERSGHDIAVQVDIEAGVHIEQIDCINHEILVDDVTDTRTIARLDPADSIPNKDFVLRYQVAGQQIKSAALVHAGDDGGYFTLMVYPPADLKYIERGPMEMIFVVDCSGSMSGEPIAQAKAAIDHALRKMRPQDSFQIIRFSNNASQLGPAPLLATPENIAKGREYLANIYEGGGTMMIEGIKAALDFPHDPHRLRTVTFLTDGYIGNEAEIFKAVAEKLGESRIFSFGVGSSVNRYLLDGLARMGHGTAAYLSLTDNAANVMDRYFERVSHAAMTGIEIDWGNLEVFDMYPGASIDLFVGRPLILTGRFKGTEPTAVTLYGTAAGEPTEVSVLLDPTDEAATHAGLASVWARHKIADLAYAHRVQPSDELRGQIEAVALEYGLMSDYTAFVAVDSTERTAGGEGATVPVPVPVPDGVDFANTVSAGAGQ